MSTIALTPKGKIAAENTAGVGPEFAVLSLLYEANSPMEVEEVLDAVDMEDEKAQMVIRRLINKDHVKEL